MTKGLSAHSRNISVIGLGYVGLPVAVAFAKDKEVIAFDINIERIQALKDGYDHTGEVDSKILQSAHLLITSEAEALIKADFHIVTVPTPIDSAKQPDLSPLISASKTIGQYLKKGDIVVYESTVYPGVTEDICMPVLEDISGLKGGEDFFVGYSPERINPGDKEHNFTSIKKVVSGQTPEIEDIVANVYSSVVTAGVHKTGSIKVAEAAKVIENSQRDLNIAFVNELTLIFNQLGISIHDVLKAANTKWNFLSFTPGLVGGHCIGVDPYYLTHLAEKLDYHPEVILAGRRINDRMGKRIAEFSVKEIIKEGISLEHLKVGVLGFTFKENCPDVRNTKVIDVINELKSYNICPIIYDPVANKSEAYKEYNVELSHFDALEEVNVVVLTVAHKEFLSEKMITFLERVDLIVDVKNILNKASNFKKVVCL